MDRKKFNRIVRNPRHISGIHNYCDRWCERCPFTLRCSVAAMGAEVDEEREPHDRKDEELWGRLEGVRAVARELLEKHADHAGVPVAKEPMLKRRKKLSADDSDPGFREVDTDPLGSAMKRYMEFAHAFVKQQQEILPETAPTAAVDVSPAEAFEVIHFYHTMILVKGARALSRDEFDEQMEEDLAEDEDPNARFQTDQNGTAKVVLICIDRTILAWTALMQHVPAMTEAALSCMLTLDRLRRGLEKRFPDTGKFVRPGFDTVKFPERKG